jgi:uncharacterized delta-60 repeat protein
MNNRIERVHAAALEALESRRLLAAGTTDLSFGKGGLSVTDTATRRPGAVIAQADGTFLVAAVGGFFNGSERRDILSITRYRSDGSLDRSFGIDGHKSFARPEDTRIVSGVPTTDGGLLLTIGRPHNAPDRLLKFTPAGEPDTSFGGGDGEIVFRDLTSPDHHGFGNVRTGPGGRIFFSFVHDDDNRTTHIRALRADGSTDTAWANGGEVAIVGQAYNEASFQIDASGRLWASIYNNHTEKYSLSRLRADGSPDIAYGVKTLNLTGFYRFVLSAVLPDNRLVFSNLWGPDYSTGNVLALRRVTPAGKLDVTYGGGDGAVDVNVPRENSDPDKPLMVAPDGRIAYVYSTQTEVYRDDPYGVTVVRSNGVLDPRFGTNGQQFHDLPFQYRDSAALLQPDGKIVIAGATFDPVDVGMLRYGTDGQFDKTFDVDGLVLPGPANRLLGEFNDSVVLSDGRIVAVGRTGRAGSNDLLVARYTKAGVLDTSFAGKGWFKVDMGRDDIGLQAFAVAGGKYLIAATSGLVRVNSDGALDRTFAGSGVVKTRLTQAQLQPDGKIVYASGDAKLRRLHANGSVDSTFTAPGVVEPYRDLRLTKLEAYPGNRWLVSGTIDIDDAVDDRPMLMRFHADGSRDKSFDGDGLAFPKTKRIDLIAVNPADGAIRYVEQRPRLIFGEYGTYVDDSAFVGRIKSNGKADTSFGGGVRLHLGSDYAPAGTDPDNIRPGLLIRDLHVRSDGKMILTGDIHSRVIGGPGDTPYREESHPMLMRLNADGTLDVGFDGNGFAAAYLPRADQPGENDYAMTNPARGGALSFAADGSIVVVGAARYANTVPMLARFGADNNDRVSLTSMRQLVVEGTAGDDRVTSQRLSGDRIQVTFNGQSFVYPAARVEDAIVTGGAGNDSIDLSATAANLWLRGGAGNDTLISGAGSDSVFGDDGNDAISGGTGNDTIDAGAGNDTISGDGGDDWITDPGANSTSQISGGDGNDQLRTEALRATISGGAGRDAIAFQYEQTPTASVSHAFYGGRDDDSIAVYPLRGTQLVSGESGFDTVNFNGFLSGITVTIDGVANDGRAGDKINVMPGTERIPGTQYNDRMIGSAADEVFIGERGNDFLDGGGGNDTLYGDSYWGGESGADTLLGGAGDDVLVDTGTGDTDQLDGGAGVDRLYLPHDDDPATGIEQILNSLDGIRL